jgi:PPOX class probable F420-dependent enzyme
MTTLTEKQREFLKNPYFATATTLREDGSPHNTVVWVDVDDDGLFYNTVTTRAKGRHLQRDPRTAVTVIDPQDPFKWITVTGTAELSTEDGNATIDRLAQKYTGRETYPWHKPDEQRVTVRVRPEKIDATGLDE